MKQNNQKKPIIILDANAFISNPNLLSLGTSHQLVTTYEVLEELRDEKTRQIIEKFPFTINKLNFQKKSLQAIKQFAKKTGDLASLSEVDLELLALSHTLYQKEGLSDKLRKNPPPMKEYESTQIEEQSQPEDQSSEQEDQGQWITVPKSQKKPQRNENEDMDDDEGWITPQNYDQKIVEGISTFQQKKAQIQQEEEQYNITLMTADYAMQNVATQIGMHLISSDGRKIKELRRFIWECFTCWKQYKQMDGNKVHLCKQCGYNSISKIAYSIDSNGNMILHRKRGWKPNQKVLEWKERKYQEQEKKKKHQNPRRKKQPSIFQS